jgi:hypothetical protein
MAAIEEVTKRIKSIAYTVSGAFVVSALGVIWALITHQVTLK